MSVFVRGEFLVDAKRFFDEFPEVAEKAAVMAINTTAERKAVPMIRRDAESQVNFPSGYLDGDDRLGLTQRATRGSMEAVITARDRPTSLARFIVGEGKIGQSGITVRVKKTGGGNRMDKAFVVKLKNGNRGVAIRLKPGETPDRAYKPVMLADNVWLLYGPSVDQVVRTVAEAALPEIGDLLSDEFYRNFDRLSRG